MKSRVATCLLLCVLAIGFVSATEAVRQPGFLEFVAFTPAHIAAAQNKAAVKAGAQVKGVPAPGNPKSWLIPSPTVSPKAYTAAYALLNKKARSYVGKLYKSIKQAKKPAAGAKPKPATGAKPAAKPATPKTGTKILNPSTAGKTNAQKGAARQAGQKKVKRANWRKLTSDEEAALKKEIARVRAARAAARKARANKKRPTQAERVAAWNKLPSAKRVQWFVRRHFKKLAAKRRFRLGVLAWNRGLVRPQVKAALMTIFPSKLKGGNGKPKVVGGKAGVHPSANKPAAPVKAK